MGGDARFAIEAFRKDARDRRLADATGAGKQKRVVHPPGLERIHQRAPDMLLTNQLGECFGRQVRASAVYAIVYSVRASRRPFFRRVLAPATLRGSRSDPLEPCAAAHEQEAARISRNSGTRHHRCRCCLPA